MFGKRGKYEAVPTEAAVKYQKKSAKSNLLSAYFTSLLCLILCATMFLSTSMAWFTSEVNNSGNEIYVGMLDVKLLHLDGQTIAQDGTTVDNWVDLEAEENKYHTILDSNLRWEPNDLYIERVRVQNDGDLAFNYRLGMSISYPEDFDAAKIALAEEAAKYISVYCYEIGDPETADTYMPPVDITAVTAEGSKWEKVGTLAEVLAGKIVFAGSMGDAAVVSVEEETGKLSREDTAHEYAVAFHMDLNAPNDIMGAQLKNINIKLIAAQAVAGNEAFKGMYDELAVVFDEDGLREAVTKSGYVVLGENITVDETITVPADVNVTLDLNGHTVSGVCDGSQGHLVMVTHGATLNVKDSSTEQEGKITYAKGSSDVGWTIDVEGELNLYSGTIELTGESWSIGYAVDVRPNAWGVEYTKPTVFHMYGGKVVSSDGAIRVASSSSDSYAKVSASFIMDAGEVVAAWDGIFVQQSNAAYDTLSVTVNGGTITSELAPIRIYGPYATSVNAGSEVKPITITVKADSLVMGGTADPTRVWYEQNKIMLGGDLAEEHEVNEEIVSCKDYLEQYANITIQ